jgi:hypothetical protein
MDAIIPVPLTHRNDASLSELQRQLADAVARIATLDHRVSRLALRCDALQVAAQQSGISDNELLSIENRLKSRPVGTAFRCAKCNQVLQAGAPNCIYCGMPHMKAELL